MKRMDVVVLGGMLAVLALCLPPVLRAQSEKANRTRCANNLRQLGLAAVQYADDKRFFPHVGKLTQLDQGVHSSDTPRLIRSLLWYGYHDTPEGYICPASDDNYLEVVDSEIGENLRLWSWDRKRGDARLSPIVQREGDPTLAETTELSYGWTRKGMNSNVRSTAVLAADRSVRDGRDKSALRGNHDDGWNVLQADGSVRFQGAADKMPSGDSAGAWLVKIERGGAYLSCKAQPKSDSLGGVTPRPAPTPWAGQFGDEAGQVRIKPRAWSERENSWSFTGEVVSGETKLRVWGRAGADNATLTGTVDQGTGLPTAALSVQGDELSLTVGGATRTLKRKADQVLQGDPRLEAELRKGVARAFFSAARTHNKAAAEALLTRESVEKLNQDDVDWFETLGRRLARDESAAPEAKERRLEDLQRRVVSSEGTLKIDVVNRGAKAGGARKGPPRPVVAPVISLLKTISIAQSLFREGDKDDDGMLDYAGSLNELIDARLISGEVAQGTSDGYRVEVCNGSTAPEFIWMAVALPKSGQGTHYAINHEGVLYEKDAPFFLDRAECKISGGKPVGR